MEQLINELTDLQITILFYVFIIVMIILDITE